MRLPQIQQGIFRAVKPLAFGVLAMLSVAAMDDSLQKITNTINAHVDVRPMSREHLRSPTLKPFQSLAQDRNNIDIIA